MKVTIRKRKFWKAKFFYFKPPDRRDTEGNIVLKYLLILPIISISW